uniref:Uncharacterized protein n=1 Tax=Panagrolaimus davidi TaxID=227884 RepID=A0A914QTH7_9BILA
MESLKEYTKEEINNLEAFKSEIEKVPKTFRLIKLSDYEYGLSSNGKKDHRIIVKEERDKSKVREYSKNGKNYWYCSKCKSSAFLKFKYGILFAAIQHGNGCETKEYSFAKKIQSLLKQGKFNEAHGDVTPTNFEDMFIIFGFIIIGLSLVSMCINVVQLKLKNLFEELLMTILEEYGASQGEGGIIDAEEIREKSWFN